MRKPNSKTPSPQLARAITRYGYLISLAARRGYSQRALNALALSAIAAEEANRTQRRRAVKYA